MGLIPDYMQPVQVGKHFITSSIYHNLGHKTPNIESSNAEFLKLFCPILDFTLLAVANLNDASPLIKYISYPKENIILTFY